MKASTSRCIFLVSASLGIALAWLSLDDIATQDRPDNISTLINTPHQITPPVSRHSLPTESISAEAWLSRELASTSLAQTQPPGQFVVDAAGVLVVDGNCKAVLDYFLALIGEMPDDDIRVLLSQWVSQTHNHATSDQVMAVFDRYRVWLRAFAEGDYAASDHDDVAHQLRERRLAREQILGREWSDGLYQQEDAYDDFSLARARILRADMPETRRNQALLALEAQRPSDAAAAYQQQRALQQFDTVEQDMRARGASDTDIYHQRSQTFGAAAAQRLAQLDQQREQWDARYRNYRQQKTRLLEAGLSSSDQKDEIDRLRARLFSPTEVLRVDALDRLDTSAP